MFNRVSAIYLALVVSAVTVATQKSCVLAREVKPAATSLLSQNQIYLTQDYSRRRLKAVSGPDDQGRWRFYKPSDVSEDSMQAEGCTNVYTNGPDWRCPDSRIRVEVDGDDSSDDYSRSRRRLRAASGPDDRGRWRFYKPSNVSDDAMKAEGCTNVYTDGPDWRCPDRTIKVDANDERW